MNFSEKRQKTKSRFEEVIQPRVIRQAQLEGGMLFSTRQDAFTLIRQNNPRILEIGCLAGDYAWELISFLEGNIAEYCLLDLFNQPDWFNSNSPRFDWSTHLDFVKRRFSQFSFVTTVVGNSAETLPQLKGTFDFIYIDADHSYESVRRELNLSLRLLSRDGLIGLNDYIMHDYFVNEDYGVVRAVNEFLWEHPKSKVVGFSFNGGLFADIYIKLH